MTASLQVPLSYADAIIGTNGANILFARRTSGATITIQETRSSTGVPEMVVEMKGNTQQVQTAEQLLQVLKQPLNPKFCVKFEPFLTWFSPILRASLLLQTNPLQQQLVRLSSILQESLGSLRELMTSSRWITIKQAPLLMALRLTTRVDLVELHLFAFLGVILQ